MVLTFDFSLDADDSETRDDGDVGALRDVLLSGDLNVLAFAGRWVDLGGLGGLPAIAAPGAVLRLPVTAVAAPGAFLVLGLTGLSLDGERGEGGERQSGVASRAGLNESGCDGVDRSRVKTLRDQSV